MANKLEKIQEELIERDDELDAQLLKAAEEVQNETFEQVIADFTGDIEAYSLRLMYNKRTIYGKEGLDLIRRAQAGDIDARNEYLDGQYKMLIKFAAAFKKANPRAEFLDLVQEGFLGIVRALETFDPDRDVSPTTYFVPWIRCYIVKYLKNFSNGSIRVPVHVSETRGIYAQYAQALSQQLMCEPTRTQIIEFMSYGLLLKELDKEAEFDIFEDSTDDLHCMCLDYISEDEISKRIAALKDRTELYLDTTQINNNISLDDTIAEDGDKFEEIIGMNDEAPELSDIDQRAIAVRAKLNAINPRDRDIICYKLGIEGEVSHTLMETSQKFGITGERVRQIIQKFVETDCKAIKAKFKEA